MTKVKYEIRRGGVYRGAFKTIDEAMSVIENWDRNTLILGYKADTLRSKITIVKITTEEVWNENDK